MQSECWTSTSARWFVQAAPASSRVSDEIRGASPPRTPGAPVARLARYATSTNEDKVLVSNCITGLEAQGCRYTATLNRDLCLPSGANSEAWHVGPDTARISSASRGHGRAAIGAAGAERVGRRRQRWGCCHVASVRAVRPAERRSPRSGEAQSRI